MATERTIYIMLSRSTTVLSRLIGVASRAEFTHASISLKGPCGPYYSFGRLYPRLPFPGGFVAEAPGVGFYAIHPDTPCRLYKLRVSKVEYNQLRHYIKQIKAKKNELRYNLLGLVLIFLRHPMPREDCYFCSEFVAEALEASGIAQLPHPAYATHPEDFQMLSGTELVYDGWVDGIRNRTSLALPNT